MPTKPLDGQHAYSDLGFQHIFLLAILQAELVESLLHLLHQFTPMRNNPDFARLMVINKPLHHRSHHVRLTRTRRHLHNHRVAVSTAQRPTVSGNPSRGQHLDDVLQHHLLIVIKLDCLH